MPEGDSVYRLAARLRAALDGRLIGSGEVRGGAAAGTALSGWTVVEHDTWGKHLFTRFDTGWTLHTHLRMQGSWTVIRPGRRPPTRVDRQARVRLGIADGATAWGIDLPVVELLRSRDESAVTDRLGPDPLRADWDPAEATRRLRSDPTRPVIAALLDQRLMAGLGNLWANELCFLRGLHPSTPIGSVGVEELVDAAARALVVSSTVEGMYQTTAGGRRGGARHWVTGRAGRPCLRCGTPIAVRAEVPGDPERRRTWWCPSCQLRLDEVRAGSRQPGNRVQ